MSKRQLTASHKDSAIRIFIVLAFVLVSGLHKRVRNLYSFELLGISMHIVVQGGRDSGRQGCAGQEERAEEKDSPDRSHQEH